MASVEVELDDRWWRGGGGGGGGPGDGRSRALYGSTIGVGGGGGGGGGDGGSFETGELQNIIIIIRIKELATAQRGRLGTVRSTER